MIDVHRISDDEQWNTYVERASGGSIFHRTEFLRVIEEASGTELDLLVGKNGEHPIGILPVFSGRTGPFRTTFSPPPHTGIPHLGPATMLDPNIKYRKAVTRINEFVESSLEWIDAERAPHYVRIVSDPAFDEVRAFRWLGFDVDPRFTYELDLDRNESDLLQSFSRDARTSITDSYDQTTAVTDGGEHLRAEPDERSGAANGTDGPGYRIDRGGPETVEFVASRLEQRFAEQGETFPLSADLMQTLYEVLPDESVHAYQLSVDGDPVTGRLSLHHGDRLTFWQGVPKPTVDVDVPINDLLNWHSMCVARSHGCDVADLSGANVERLWNYKAKFNPELTTYYVLERTSLSASPAVSLYKWLAER